MDITCPRCTEPWGVLELHDTPDALPFEDARKRFFEAGCGLTFGTTRCPDRTNDPRALASRTLHELLGSDVDGIAAMMDDLDYLGELS